MALTDALAAGDSCDVTVVPDGVQLYFSSGDYPMSTLLTLNELLGVLDATTTVLVFESRGEPLEIELDAGTDDVLAANAGLRKLDQRLHVSGDRRPPPSANEAVAPTDDADDGAPG